MDSITKTLYAWLLAIHIVRGGNTSCPESDTILPCICANRSNDLQIWCTHSDLPQVVKGIERIGYSLTQPIDELIIENNYLPSMPGKVFQNVKIVRLMLRYNGLERLALDWLDFQEGSLMEIFIVENDLQIIPLNTLSKLDNLQAITIQSNSLKTLPMFSNLPLLKYINIQAPSLNILNNDNFANMPSLEKLYVQGSLNLKEIQENVFYNLPKLKRLEITKCGTINIHMRAISLLPSLTDFSLKGNKIHDASVVGRAMRDLQHVATLDLSGNEIETLNEASFVDLPTLEILLLSRNKINEIRYGAFHRTPKLRVVDLNFNQISRIHPESFLQHSGSGVEELSLIGNQIMHISEFRSLLDALPRLKFLDFSSNLLEEIPRGALRGHPSLERLQLNQNNIKFIDVEAFVAMPALRELRLSNNSLTDSNDGPYWELPALKGLDLSNNFFYRLQPKLLYNLPALRRIDISNNKLAMIDPIAFLEVPLIEYVNISGNALISVHPATFRNSINLFELDASSNRLVEFIPGLPRGIENLFLQKNQISSLPNPPSPDIDLPSLRQLDISSNGIERIPYSAMKMLPNLMRLYMRRNGLRQVDETTFSELDKLEILDIGDNQIISIHPKSFARLRNLNQVNLHGNILENFDFNSLEGNFALSKLDFSKNKLKQIEDNIIKRSVDVENLNISSNSLNEFPQSLNSLKKLKVLDATNNHIKYLDGEILNKCHSLVELRMPYNNLVELRSGTFQRLKDLEVINLERNQIETLHSKAITMLPNLHSIFLGWNSITELPDESFSDLPQLRILELQGNRLRDISAQAFQKVPLLQFLNLSLNQLESLEYSGLRNLVSLEVLDLSQNKIRKLSSSTFEYMKWLIELHLDNNQICYISGKPFQYMPRIKILSLKNNKLTTVAEPTFAKLKNNIAIFNIDGNPLICNCRIIWLKTWLQESYSVGPKCADGTFVKQIPFSRNDCHSKVIDLDPIQSCDLRDNEASSPLLVTSQVFSPTGNKVRDKSQQITSNNVNRIPTPEESEYFYDEYVDYPAYNETILQSLGGVNISEIKSAKSNSSLGNTPTMYAGPSKSNSTSKTQTSNSASSSNTGFTFFGLPLPPLNMGKLWNTGRKLDWPATDTKTLQSSNKYHKFQYDEPKFETGGFAPMLPTTAGGFKPIPDPTRKMNMTYHSYRNSTNDVSMKISPKQHNMTSSSIVIIKNNSISANTSLPSSELIITNNSTNIKNILHEKIELSTNDNKTKLTYNKTKMIQQNSNNQGKLVDYNLTEKNLTISDDAEKDDDLKNILITTDTPNDMAIPQWLETTTGHTPSSYINTKAPIKEITSQDSPSALSAILVPSHSEGSKKNVKRPATITKVSMPNLESYRDDAYLPVNNREAKKSFNDHSDTTIRKNYADKTLDWYYKNYNNSNVEPYITPGVVKSGSSRMQISLWILVMYNILDYF